MPDYARELTQRFAHQVNDLFARVRKLETRTSAIDSGMPLAVLPAVIDPAYSSGDPKAFINGSAALTGPYNYLASYTPAAGDAVLAVPIPLTAQQAGLTSYVIIGKVA